MTCHGREETRRWLGEVLLPQAFRDAQREIRHEHALAEGAHETDTDALTVT